MSTSYEEIAITIIPMVTGTLSIVASSTIIYKVMQSQSRLSTPYNRLLFGMCAFDITTSTCYAFSTLPIPRDSPRHWLAIGNDTTCKIQGTLLVFSVLGGPLYNLALCVFFLCVIKYNMTDDKFRGGLEPYLHAVPTFYGLGTAIGTLAAGYINPVHTLCYINSPIDPDGSKYSYRLGWIIHTGPILLIFFAIVAVMFSIFLTVLKQERTMERYRFQLSSGIQSLQNSPRAMENSTRSRSRVNSVKTRSKYFFAAYLITFLPSLGLRIAITMAAGSVNALVITFAIVEKICLPLQGVFNLGAHFQPQIAAVQRENPNLWYIQAFLSTITKLDTEIDNRSRAGRRNSSSIARRRSSRLQNSAVPPSLSRSQF